MSDYRLVHSTRYDLDAAVAVEAMSAQLRPRDLCQQRVRMHQLIVRPGARKSNAGDGFGNAVTKLDFTGSTAVVEIHAVSELEITPVEPRADANESWERARDLHSRGRPDATRFARPSGEMASAAVMAAAHDYARSAFTAGQSLTRAACALARKMRAEFSTDPAAVHVAPHLASVFEARSGICQDRARAALACLRAYGLAARYVGGYVYDGSRAQLHAWVSVRLPDGTWLDLDPSLADDPTHTRITVGWGLDARDVVPIRGSFVADGRQRMESKVTMQRINADSDGVQGYELPGASSPIGIGRSGS